MVMTAWIAKAAKPKAAKTTNTAQAPPDMPPNTVNEAPAAAYCEHFCNWD
jgi:hypothetical protein